MCDCPPVCNLAHVGPGAWFGTGQPEPDFPVITADLLANLSRFWSTSAPYRARPAKPIGCACGCTNRSITPNCTSYKNVKAKCRAHGFGNTHTEIVHALKISHADVGIAWEFLKTKYLIEAPANNKPTAERADSDGSWSSDWSLHFDDPPLEVD